MAEEELEEPLDEEAADRFLAPWFRTSEAIEPYAHLTHKVDALAGEDKVMEAMLRAVSILPRSRGPRLPTRVVLLGPRGSRIYQHAFKLAAHFGAVFVDGPGLRGEAPREAAVELSVAAPIDLPEQEEPQEPQAPKKEDPLGVVGMRLRQADCAAKGWVLCGFPRTQAQATALVKDSRLAPNRVVCIRTPLSTCCGRLEFLATDPCTREIWLTRPSRKEVRARLVKAPEDKSEALREQHEAFEACVGDILGILAEGGACKDFADAADAAPVFAALVDFIERPPALKLSCGAPRAKKK